MPRQLDYYFSMPSPWAYIGHAAFKELVAAHGVKVRYRPVMLGELFSDTGGLPLPKRHPSRQRYRMIELQRWREKRGLDFKLQPKNWPFNGRLADGVVIAALEAGHDPDAYVHRGFKAVWEEERDLADPAEIAALADSCGLPGQALVARSQQDDIGAVYEQNRQDAIAAGVFGAPAYVLDGEVFWGQDRLELLADALKTGRQPFGA